MGTASKRSNWLVTEMEKNRNVLSVSAAAKKYGVSVSTVRRWLSGATKPNLGSHIKIIKALPASFQLEFFSYLFSGPWKTTSEKMISQQNELLEILKSRADQEANRVVSHGN